MDMPAASGIPDYEKTLIQLQQDTDAMLDSFIVTAELGRGFESLMEKMEEQISAAEQLQKSQSDLELNEAIVLADKLEAELAALERVASGAVISETEGQWASHFERLHASLDRMDASMMRLKAAHATGAKPKGAPHLTFHREAKQCRMRLSSLRSMLVGKKHPIHAKVHAAKQRISSLRSGVSGMLSKIAKIRLRKKIAEARMALLHFIEKSGKGRIFIDHRHLLLTSNGEKMRVPLTQSVCFGFEEIVPLGATPVQLGKSVLVGSYEKKGNVLHFRVGERRIVGDSVIYKEREFFYG